MKITFLDWSCFGRENCISAFKQLGHDVTLFFHPEYDLRKSAAFDAAFDVQLGNHPCDVVFSFNFYPLVAEGCKRNNVKYISIVYDSATCILVFLHDYLSLQLCLPF